MPTDKPVSLRDLLSRPDSVLSTVSGAVRHMDDLAVAVRSSLPEALRPHLMSASIRDERLILVADSAVWAARLRYYVSDAMQGIASIHTSPLAGADIRVRPDWPSDDPSKRDNKPAQD